MKKYIDINEIDHVMAREIGRNILERSDEAEDELYHIWNALKAIPGEDVAEIRRGRWSRVSPLVDTLECSACGYNIIGDEMKTPYCPWCGARIA